MMDHGGVIRRHELSDAEWELLEPLLPRSAKGRPRLDDRTVLNGIKADAAGDIDWLVSVDCTIVRAHQHAAGARKGGPRTRRSVARGAG